MSGRNSGTMARDLTTGSVPRQLISFAAPLFFSGLLQTVYNMVDMVVVGRFVGAAGLSAVAVGGEVLTFLTFIAMGVSNAGQVIISQYLGAGMKEKISKLIGTLFSFFAGLRRGIDGDLPGSGGPDFELGQRAAGISGICPGLCGRVYLGPGFHLWL